MKPMFVAMVIITVMVLPSVASDKTVFGRDNLTSDPWMVQGPAQANKPTHVIDGSTKGVNIVVGSILRLHSARIGSMSVLQWHFQPFFILNSGILTSAFSCI